MNWRKFGRATNDCECLMKTVALETGTNTFRVPIAAKWRSDIANCYLHFQDDVDLALCDSQFGSNSA